jgi:hypothetical protein
VAMIEGLRVVVGTLLITSLVTTQLLARKVLEIAPPVALPEVETSRLAAVMARSAPRTRSGV